MTDLKALFDPVRSRAPIPLEPMDGLRRRVRRRRNRRRALAAGLASVVLVGGLGVWQTTDGDGDATTEIRTADQPGEEQAAEPTFVLEERVRPPKGGRFDLRLGWASRGDERCAVVELSGGGRTSRTDACTGGPVDDVYATRFASIAGDVVLGWVEPDIEEWATDAVAVTYDSEPVRAFGGRRPFVFFTGTTAEVRIEAPFEDFRNPDLFLPLPRPEPGPNPDVDDLELTLEVTSTAVRSGGRLRTALLVRNPTNDPIPDPTCVVAGGYGIGLATPDEPEVFVASTGVTVECAGTARFLAGSRTSIPLRAFELAGQDGEPLRPGDYLAVLKLGAGAPDVDPVPVRVTEAEE